VSCRLWMIVCGTCRRKMPELVLIYCRSIFLELRQITKHVNEDSIPVNILAVYLVDMKQEWHSCSFWKHRFSLQLISLWKMGVCLKVLLPYFRCYDSLYYTMQVQRLLLILRNCTTFSFWIKRTGILNDPWRVLFIPLRLFIVLSSHENSSHLPP
jgi:hypothetical protein